MNKKTASYTVINGVLVWISPDVVDFTVPDGVIEVADRAIHPNIKRIVFSDSVEKFYIPVNNNIREIILPISLMDDDYGFKNLAMSKVRLGIPRGYDALQHSDFLKCKRIILRYKTLNDLFDYERKTGYDTWCSLDSELFDANYRGDIECIGPRLNNRERRQVKRYFNESMFGKAKKRIKVVFSQPREVKEEEEEIISRDSEIQLVVSQIQKICEKLPANYRKAVLDKVDELLINYDKKLEEYRPKYNKESEIELELGSAKTSKAQLIASLQSIVLSLASENELTNFLSEIDSYRKLVVSKISEEASGDSLEASIKNVIYYANMLDERRKKVILGKLDKYLLIAENGINSKLSILKGNGEIILENPVDYKADLGLNVSKLLDETKLLADKVGPYKEFRDSLSGINTEIDHKKKTIATDINTLRWVLANLSKSKYRDDLEKRVNALFKKYEEKVSKLLSDDELLNKDNYEKLELAFREEIDPILEEVRSYSYLDKYETNTANKVNIRGQLDESILLINGIKNTKFNKPIKVNKDTELNVITSFVVDLYNQIVSNREISDEVKQKMIADLLDKLNEAFLILESASVTSLKEYNQVLRDILNKLAKVQVNLWDYISDLNYYNEHSR